MSNKINTVTGKAASRTQLNITSNTPNENLGVVRSIREDIVNVLRKDPAARHLLEVLLVYPGIHALILHRLSYWLWQHKFKLVARIIALLGRWWTGIEIHPAARIGRRLMIDHGLGIVVGETAQIGDDVTMYHGVTLGGTRWDPVKRHPTVGNNVLLGAGAKVLGAITVGDGVKVGANAVVTRDVPDNVTVVGIPARIIGHSKPAAAEFDDVGKETACILKFCKKPPLELSTTKEALNSRCGRQ